MNLHSPIRYYIFHALVSYVNNNKGPISKDPQEYYCEENWHQTPLKAIQFKGK